MGRQRHYLAFAAAIAIALAVIGTLAWLINSNDWGIALIFIAPLIVWGLYRIARRLDQWAQGDGLN